MKNTSRLLLIGLIILLDILAIMVGRRYNNLVGQSEEVTKHWSMLQIDYQTRADKIMQLTIESSIYSNAEKEALADLQKTIEEAEATTSRINYNILSQVNIDKVEHAQTMLWKGYNENLAIINSKYPYIANGETFKGLKESIDNAQDSLAVSRKEYNRVVGIYNSNLSQFPSNLTAMVFNFRKKGYLSAQADTTTRHINIVKRPESKHEPDENK